MIKLSFIGFTYSLFSRSFRVVDTRLLCFIFFIPTLVNGQVLKETYPRIAGVEIASSKKVAHPDYREKLAKHDMLILGFWTGWSFNDQVTGEQLTIRDVVVDIRRRAESIGNRNIRIGKYTNINESTSDPDAASWSEPWNKLHSEVGPGYPKNNDWYARDKNGDNVEGWPGSWLTNVTEYVQRDKDGFTYPEWAATRNYRVFFRDIPEFDIWYVDNWFYRPRKNLDWDGDGTNDDKNSEKVRIAYRKGYVNALRRARELAPNMLFVGNVDGDVAANRGMLTEPEFRGQLSALYEGAIGMSWSEETWGSWELMMQRYQTTISNAQHNLTMISVHGEKNDYQLMRYGLASCLMDDGYYYYTSHKEEYASAYWYDEYDVNLGRAVDPPQFSPRQSGVYMRRFENGLVLVNPKGNGTRTVQVEAGYQRIKGVQDPSTNNGDPVDSLTLRERDGIILVRTDGTNKQSRPKPPVLRVD
jgi:hypothetical protein